MRSPTNSTASRSIRLAIGTAFFVILLLVISAAPDPTKAQGSGQATPAATQAEPENKGHGFVGQVEDSQAFIALQVIDSQVKVFVCDGTKTSISYWQWYTGQIDNGSLNVTAPNGEKLSAQLDDNVVTGTVTLGDKKTHNFKAALASGSAGLFRTEFTIDKVDYVGGWIALPDGQVRGGMQDKKGKKKPLIIIIAILIG